MWGLTIIGLIKGDIRSLDCCSAEPYWCLRESGDWILVIMFVESPYQHQQ